MFIANFMCSDNYVDGDTLLTLVVLTPGPDCLKELIPKNWNKNSSLQDH